MNTPQLKQDARLAWGIVPQDLKPSLSALKASGKWDEARPALEQAAVSTLKRIGKYSILDVCWALEEAAKNWLETHQTEGAAK